MRRLDGLRSTFPHLYYETHKIRAIAAMLLGKIGDAQAIEPLCMALRTGKDHEVQTAAANALEKIGKPAVEPLCTLIKDEDGSVRNIQQFELQWP